MNNLIVNKYTKSKKFIFWIFLKQVVHEVDHIPNCLSLLQVNKSLWKSIEYLEKLKNYLYQHYGLHHIFLL
jgi:hypothetical protein